MGAFKYPESSESWARRQGIVSKCATHNIAFDPHVGCPKCKAAAASTSKAKPDIFSNVVWPDSKQLH